MIETLAKESGTGSGLHALLRDFIHVDGVNAAVVISRDGFVIDGETTGAGLDNEAVGAVVSVGIESTAVMANELQVGEIGQIMFECSGGIVIVTCLRDNAVLALVSDTTTNLGNLRHQLKKRLPAIEAAL